MIIKMQSIEKESIIGFITNTNDMDSTDWKIIEFIFIAFLQLECEPLSNEAIEEYINDN